MSIDLVLHERGGELVHAADRLGVSLEEVEHFLRIAGDGLGPPWHKEHRQAAAAAMAVLADRATISLFA